MQGADSSHLAQLTPGNGRQSEALPTSSWSSKTFSHSQTQLCLGGRGVEVRGLKAGNPDIGAMISAGDAIKHRIRLSLRHRRGES